MLSSMRLCSNVPAQAIVQTALGGYQSVAEYVKPGGRVYEQRECIYNALKDIPGISVVKPHAAFYIFPKLDVEKFNITDDEQFALSPNSPDLCSTASHPSPTSTFESPTLSLLRLTFCPFCKLIDIFCLLPAFCQSVNV